MKKIIALLFALVLAFTVAGCSSTKTAENSSTTEKTVVTNYDSGARKTETKYVFDASGETKSIHTDYYSEDGVLLSSSDYEGTQLVRMVNYNADGSFLSWNEYTYDSDGNQTRVSCDASGNPLN